MLQQPEQRHHDPARQSDLAPPPGGRVCPGHKGRCHVEHSLRPVAGQGVQAGHLVLILDRQRAVVAVRNRTGQPVVPGRRVDQRAILPGQTWAAIAHQLRHPRID